MMKRTNCRPQTILLQTITVLLLFSCKKENQSADLTGNNRWVLDSMKVYYYWKDQLPRNPQDQSSTTAFFKSLLNPADRFSFLFDPSENRAEYSSFAWYGFEYAILENRNRPGEFIGTITLVVPDGPADQKGLKRGDIFTGVNGITLTRTNPEQIAKVLRLGDGVDLSIAKLNAGELIPADPVTIRYSRYIEQPVYLSKIFRSGAKKTGYIFYNQFAGDYDHSILQTLADLRNEGIGELILDLRYNPGGEVSTAAKIAAALSKVTSDQTFVIYQGNSNGGRRISSFQRTMDENSFQPQSFSDLLNYRLSLNRVIILTSGSTASAAELLINNLKPYTSVVQIGTPTMGKDMASFAIEDLRNPKQVNLVLHPLVFKLYNAQNAGNYETGLKPDYAVDEFAAFPLKPFGDPEDPLIRKALEITGIQAAKTSGIKSADGLNTNLKYLSSVRRNREHSSIEVRSLK